MDLVVTFANHFIGMFQAGADVFMGFITGIVPLLICLILAVNAFIKTVGEEKVFNFMKKCTKFMILRYTLIPMLSMFFLTNPMAYTFGRFLKEEHKPAFYDSAVSFCHPITGLFPHANPAELFVFLGIAQGYAAFGGNQTELAIRYFLAGVIIICMKGFVTEKITSILMIREERTTEEVTEY